MIFTARTSAQRLSSLGTMLEAAHRPRRRPPPQRCDGDHHAKMMMTEAPTFHGGGAAVVVIGGHMGRRRAFFLGSLHRRRAAVQEGDGSLLRYRSQRPFISAAKWGCDGDRDVEGGPFCRAVIASATSSALLQLTTCQRHKSYVVKFVRGHLPSDLKDVAGPIGALYGSLPDADEYSSFRMPAAYLNHYHQVGYVTMPHAALSPQQCDKLADEVMQLANDREHHPKMENLYATSLTNMSLEAMKFEMFFCQGQWRASWALHDLIYMPRFTVPCSQILGNTVLRLWYDEVVMKNPRKGPCIPWQQNYARWQHTKPMNHVTVAIALDTLTKDRGAPCVIAGSHRWRDGQCIPTSAFDPSKDEIGQINSIWDIVNEDEREMVLDTPPETIELQRGQAMFIHPMTLHCTHGNRTLDYSKMLLLHFMGTPTYAVHAGSLLPKTTRFPAESVIHGPYFPVVFDPSVVEDMPPANPQATLPPADGAGVAAGGRPGGT